MTVIVSGLYRGRRGTALPDGTASGMIKSAVDEPVHIGVAGVAADYQADRLVHGGPDKAVHHYPAEHYGRLAAAFPAVAALLVPGALGENMTSHGLDEHGVHLGDVYALGGVRLQLTQPRRPCWKIDRRFEQRGLAACVAGAGLTGWYYRVLTPGACAAGEALELLERADGAPSVAEFHAALATPRPSLDRLARYAALPTLPAALRARLASRLDWLRRHPPR
ncbi:MAG: MOSC domain-containing protein [Gammaproteobacteria bacterium]